MDIGKDGKFFTSVNRSAGTDVASIKVFDTDGITLLWDSLSAGGNPDPLRQARAIQVSPDGKFLAIVHDDSHVSLLPLTNGIPDLGNLSTISIPPLTAFGRDLAWDAALNVYTVSSGQGLLRAYSLGLTTTAITRNDITGTNGTFQISTPASTASVTATTPNASEAGPTPGTFTITRSGNLGSPLVVNYTLSGIASNGVDYVLLPSTVTIAAGQSSTNLTITPIDDSLSELSETVILTVRGGPGYSAVSPTVATITIADNDAQVLSISAVDPSMYERITNDYAQFRITRLGDTNAASYTIGPASYTYSGTAISNIDFVPVSSSLSIDPGVVSITNQISPLDNNVFSGDKTVIIGLVGGAGFTAATNKTSVTIIDDENPPERVLFADSLTADTSANWHTNFSANNFINDFRVGFAYNVTADGIPAAPNGSATALKV
ncbi:MAG: Calx-beta domain-containing protein, partial [Limisphaerales bacterium]